MSIVTIANGIVADTADLDQGVFDQDFVKVVLDHLKSTTLGKSFLEEFDPGKKASLPQWGPAYNNATVVIKPAKLVATERPTAKGKFEVPVARTTDATTALDGNANTKAQLIYIWHPGSTNSEGQQFNGAYPWTFDYHGDTEDLEIALAHELIHAYLELNNNKLNNDQEEEMRVVGLWQFKMEVYTENRFRIYLNKLADSGNVPQRVPRPDYKGDKKIMRDDTVELFNYETLQFPVNGVPVVEVLDDSPAAKAGIKARDFIVQVGQKPVATYAEFEKALKALPNMKGTQELNLTVVHGSDREVLTIPITDKRANFCGELFGVPERKTKK